MAFLRSGLARVNAGVPKENAPQIFAYQSTTDTTATIRASAYFNTAAQVLTNGDLIYVKGSDGEDLLNVSSVTGATPVTVANFIGTVELEDGSVTNAKVAAGAAIDWNKMAALTSANLLVGNGSNVATVVAMSGDIAIDNAGATTIQANAVEKSMLAAGITASHMIVFAGQPTTTGGAAAEAFTVTGALATDLAFVQIVNDGTSNVTVLQAVMTADTLTVTFSADPVADTVINYQVVRATS